MLDLLLISPGAAREIYSGLGDELLACEPPLWCRIIAGYVRDRCFTVKILDAEAEGLSPERIATRVNGEDPRIVCIVCYGHQPSASTQQMHAAGRAAKAIKERVATAKIIMVGGHVAALSKRTLREEAIDYACNGEGPVTIVGLLRGDPVENIPGLVWRNGAGEQSNPRAAFPDMKDLHGNAWDLLSMPFYRSHNWQRFGELDKRQPYASIHTTLNCPFKCSFCCISAPFGDNRYRKRDPAEVVDEIFMLHDEYGVSTFKITDEMFVLSEPHYTAICEGIIRDGIGDRINIWAYARVDTVKPHTLDMFRRAGIRWLALGIESGSKHVRDGADKALKNDDISSVVSEIQASGISVIANYIFGLPDDNEESMRDTLDLATSLNTEFANFYSAMAYPGSSLYAEAVEHGARLPETWLGYSQHAYETHPLDTDQVRAEDVLRFRDAAFQRYYTNPAYLSMIRAKFGDATVANIEAMTKKTIRRKLLEVA